MKKTLTHVPAPRHTRPRFSLPARLVAGVTLLVLLGGIGLASTRPAHTAGGPIAVSVANTPLATTAADEHAKQAVQFRTIVPMDTGAVLRGTQAYTVPIGKRLVIETVNAHFVGTPGGNYSISYAAEGGLDTVQAGGSFTIFADNSPIQMASSVTRLYAEAGSNVSVEVFRNGPKTPNTVTINFAGYLVDIAMPGGSS